MPKRAAEARSLTGRHRYDIVAVENAARLVMRPLSGRVAAGRNPSIDGRTQLGSDRAL